MGIILGKEYYQRQNDNSPIVNLNFSVPSELESFFPLKDCLLDEKTIIPQKWLLLSNTKSIPASNNITWNCVKKLVSRKKKRIMIENYNFDMSYITQKTLLMSYPGIYLEGCYRNSRKDIIHYFNKFHKNSVKVKNFKKNEIYF